MPPGSILVPVILRGVRKLVKIETVPVVFHDTDVLVRSAVSRLLYFSYPFLDRARCGLRICLKLSSILIRVRRILVDVDSHVLGFQNCHRRHIFRQRRRKLVLVMAGEVQDFLEDLGKSSAHGH